MLSTNNANDIAVSIAELSTHNLDFANRYKRFGLDKYCMINFEKRFVGFNVFDKYEKPMERHLTQLIINSNGAVFKEFLESVQKH
jgi:hypothetical protein